MRRKLWIILLLAGLSVSARPAGRRAKRLWHQWNAVQTWSACRLQSGNGEPGEPFAWLSIPEAGIEQMVIDGADKKRLYQFPCREWLGMSDLIMAHRDIHFHELEKVREGDLIQLERRGGAVGEYRCREIHIVEKDEAPELIEKYKDRNCLLLLTCYPFRYVGPAPQRFLVVAQ